MSTSSFTSGTSRWMNADIKDIPGPGIIYIIVYLSMQHPLFGAGTLRVHFNYI